MEPCFIPQCALPRKSHGSAADAVKFISNGSIAVNCTASDCHTAAISASYGGIIEAALSVGPSPRKRAHAHGQATRRYAGSR